MKTCLRRLSRKERKITTAAATTAETYVRTKAYQSWQGGPLFSEMEEEFKLLTDKSNGFIVANEERATTAGKKTKRYSILSDPRLSQLFQLSSQLEELAGSIEMMPTTTTTTTSSSPPPPELPPKMVANGNKTPNGNQPILPPRLPPKTASNGNSRHGGGRASYEIQYQRLGHSEEDDEEVVDNNGAMEPPAPPPPPPPRYSAISDSCMSTQSSQAEDSMSAGNGLASGLESSTPSAHSIHLPDASTGDNKDTTWQARCIELELSLQKFRDQAQNIRELLREKVRNRDMIMWWRNFDVAPFPNICKSTHFLSMYLRSFPKCHPSSPTSHAVLHPHQRPCMFKNEGFSRHLVDKRIFAYVRITRPYWTWTCGQGLGRRKRKAKDLLLLRLSQFRRAEVEICIPPAVQLYHFWLIFGIQISFIMCVETHFLFFPVQGPKLCHTESLFYVADT